MTRSSDGRKADAIKGEIQIYGDVAAARGAGGWRSVALRELLSHEEVLLMSPTYDKYGRHPIGIGERKRRRREVSSTARERGNPINPDARRTANTTVDTREFTQSEPPPAVVSRHELPIEELSASVAKVDEAGA